MMGHFREICVFSMEMQCSVMSCCFRTVKASLYFCFT